MKVQLLTKLQRTLKKERHTRNLQALSCSKRSESPRCALDQKWLSLIVPKLNKQRKTPHLREQMEKDP